ncbi:VWA domain-containing protein [Prevotella sp. 10(H)]|uniref:vWA domain-containing protein n=1 Tax=Prevotella sp. 10(H) TaxID=1158294 RepID=UPI0004A6C666|nr:VWA domain-containing protein [Prevotella sp. 10(H)]
MKASVICIAVLSGIMLFSCGNKNTKTTSPTDTPIAQVEPQSDILEDPVPPPPQAEIFAPPVVMNDEVISDQDEIQMSANELKASDDKHAIEIIELTNHKIVVEESEAPAVFCYVESPRESSYDRQRNEEYSQFAENKFHMVKEEPLSTFSVDVDAASYSNMRRFINRGELPYKDAVRIEELINYFSYDYPEPTGEDPVRIAGEIGACPWNPQNRLVRIGLKAKSLASDNLPASNFVFLIDVSGSMRGPTRLDLVKSSLKLLVNNLRKKDRVAIVVYAGSAGEVLPSTSGANKQKIKEALNNLSAGGSTAGGAGIQMAYKIAKQNFIKGGNNRIILCTDGDFNVGVSSNEGLQQMIETERKSGVFLSILGYGMGNYKDSKMQTLSQAGNGNHAYIDNLQEANKVLVNEFGATMYTVAKDVKLQIEFNPKKVQAYRLVGYETRMLNKEDFNDDKKDAGEMGAGHTVTALYEVVPVGVKMNVAGNVDPLKYQAENKSPLQRQLDNSMYPDLLTVKLRYKQPNGDKSKKIELPLIDNYRNEVSDDFRFAAAVAMFGQVMKDSEYKGEGSYDKAIELAQSGFGSDSQGYRREFVRLVETAKGLAKN